MNKPNNTIPDSALIPHIMKAWDELQNHLIQRRRELGTRYNWQNPYEQIDRRFGRAHTKKDAQKYLDEFKLIIEKKSNQPADVRKVINDICQRAVAQHLLTMIGKRQKGGHDADRKS